ncbi:hypothetical protein HYDPIDRAFT_30314 [Hydnomerulius pinastri MD-312]|uniref:MYND-type domain-containing protein n=1 Tax=Hydnomerulius pinastri MD-312 TaxID=994086 RepID=A0A0C9VX05_9AGAM|nr:hypothetical protein HYDPIDRAFT_30314 [Hydnomerulius pinastri MD-312]
MNGRRFGIENQLGVGGGTVSREAQRNLEKAEELCRKRKPEKALPYLFKAMEDDNNLDAFIQAAFLFPLPEAVKVLEHAEEKGRFGLKRRLEPNCFEDGSKYDGCFYQLLETRPYMRVLQAQVRLYFENGQYDKSAATVIEMLRLCPGDNLGQRTWLGSVLLLTKRASDALSFSQTWLNPDRPDVIPRGGTSFGPPSSRCLPEPAEEKLSKYGNGAMAHNAAVSAFKVFGDCELARQYLRISARINPIILTKILAKIEKPRSLNMSARTFNGPEDAQDYLFLTQDVWMEADVWEWANSVQDAKKLLFKSCANAECGAVETDVAQFKRCAACKEVVYCSQPCQKNDWKTHKPKCQHHKNLKDTIRAFQTGRPPPENAFPMASADFANGRMFMHTA